MRKVCFLKRVAALIFLLALAISVPACSSQDRKAESAPTTPNSLNETAGTESPKILIVYFTRLDNTEASLDEIIRGGGPYGAIGDSLENADVDAITSASITMLEDGAHGNVQTLAEMIQKAIGGDLFSIRTVETYPVDYDTLIEQGGEEKSGNIRPELAAHVENMEDYDVLYLSATPTGGLICLWQFTAFWKNMTSPGKE